ncbi:MAG: S8 family serine peptidase, partial [Actinomycetota bacterium]|nr:S8 family serine peptidase [Actinomycetota bacterium]
MSFTAATTNPLKRIVAATAFLCLALTGLTPATAEQAARFVSVIVQGESPAAVEKAVEAVGGEVKNLLPIVQGAEVEVPANKQELLRHQRGIHNVTPNAPVAFDAVLDAAKHAHQIKAVINTDDLWAEGIDGSGTTVALIDTGVYNHPDLAGRVTCGIDLSHEAGTEAECADTFGHGTFMAGLIAGNGASSSGKYRGAAPAANIVSVKVAGYDGSADVTHILAAIQWVVSH